MRLEATSIFDDGRSRGLKSFQGLGFRFEEIGNRVEGISPGRGCIGLRVWGRVEDLGSKVSDALAFKPHPRSIPQPKTQNPKP